MSGVEDAEQTYEYDEYYKILPAINGWSNDQKRIGNGVKVSSDFSYQSDKNAFWMTPDELKTWLTQSEFSHSVKSQ